MPCQRMELKGWNIKNLLAKNLMAGDEASMVQVSGGEVIASRLTLMVYLAPVLKLA
ncbi:MAG: hypothetical protein NTZ71_14775 [Planctomycetota bacterium]|nr:hypothetical protein [Planctomycetota bacterium]